MKLASQIPNYGMSASTDFQHNLTTLIAEETITKVVETGSYIGNGTTKAVLKGMKLHGMEYEFYSIEVNPMYYKQAVANNIGSQVKFLNGLSIPRKLEPTSISFDVPDFVVVDHSEYDKYHKELRFDVPDDMLGFAVQCDPELIILDSAGHIGYIEFQYVLGLMNGKSYYLALDDIHHVKHYQSMEYVKQHPDEFEVIWQSNEDDLHRSAILKLK